ncbi:hypothetical protein T06_3082 [Trichinella sp. T6]|nr:hypothetical protein T06_3082 [Trichinella sp. T6]
MNRNLRGKKNFFRRPKFDHDNDDDDDDDNNNRNTTIRARKAADRGVTTAHSGPSGGRTAAAAFKETRRPLFDQSETSARLHVQPAALVSVSVIFFFTFTFTTTNSIDQSSPFLSDDTDLKKYAAPPPPTLPSCVDAPCRRRDLACSGRQPS